MSITWRSGRNRLRAAAAALVFLAAGAVGYDIVSTAPTYLESATVLFSVPAYASSPYTDRKYTIPIITSGAVMTQLLMSPQAQHKIHQAGGTGNVSMALVNLYDEEYPNYGLPLATLTATSPTAANAHLTFGIATQKLDSLLSAWQARAGARPRDRISAQIVGDTGPLAQAGSSKRVLAGLAVLALLMVSGLWSIIDRRAAAIPE